MRNFFVTAAMLLLIAPTGVFAADPICGAARQAECDPQLSACLRDHAEEAKIDACMQRYRQCGDRLRMSAAACAQISEQIQVAPGLGIAPPESPSQ